MSAPRCLLQSVSFASAFTQVTSMCANSYARILIVRNDINRMKRKILGLLVLGIALVPFASSAMTTGPDIHYVSQTGSTVTADYFGLPANSQLIFVNSSTGATTTSVAAVSGTSAITVSTITVPSGSYYLRATTPTGGYIAQTTIMFPVSTLVRRVSQSNLAQGKSGGDGVFITGGTYAYIVEGSGTTNAFQIFNISDPTAPVLISQSNLANGGNGVSTDDIWVTHGFAYIVEGGGTVNALQVFDVTNPATPVLVGQANLTNNAGDRLFVQGKYAYIVEGGSYTNSFEIFNISNPAAPVRVSQSNLTAFDQASIYVQGNYAYIAIGGSATKGFDIFDVSNPAAPILKSATDLNYGVPDDGIFVSGNYAYIAEGAGTTNAFQIFDVSNPSAPVLAGQADLANAGSIDTGGGDAIWVRDGFAYIVEGGGTTKAFEIFDVSNPATPSRVSQSPLANSTQPDDIFVSGKYAYIVEGGGTTNALEIFDISRIRAAQ